MDPASTRSPWSPSSKDAKDTDVEDWVLENDVKNKAAALGWVSAHRANLSHLEAKRSALNAKFSTDLEAMIKAVRGESQNVFI